ncbi:MAG: type IX secretion system sortase PorU [Bacteroidetes bacterium]|jgi:hypothetical protein|nr:type IX secretion system sortase PorU [Bacteroidota bacterium]
MKILIGALFFLSFNLCMAQEFSVQIPWQNDMSSSQSDTIISRNIENTHYQGSNVQIPWFKKTIPLQFSQKIKTVHIKNIVTQPVENTSTAISEYLQEEENNLTPVIYNAGNKSYMIIEFCPYIHKEGQYHRIEKIVYSFSEPTTTSGSQLKSASVTGSVLQSGKWFKFKVAETGVYKLTYSDLSSLGFTNLDNISLYGNGGGMLSKKNADPRPVDLNEIPIYINRGSNQVFDAGDYILMYLEGPTKWYLDSDAGLFRQEVHGYSYYAHYFLTTDKGKATTIHSVTLTGLPANVSLNTYDYRSYYEHEKVNLLQSGRKWFSNEFALNGSKDTTFSVPDLNTSQPAFLSFGLAGRAKNGCTFKAYLNNNLIASMAIPSTNVNDRYGFYARETKVDEEISVSSDQLRVSLHFQQSSPQDRGYIDYITLNAKANLTLSNDFLLFRDASNIDSTHIIEYNLTNTNSASQIWQVSDINNIQRINASVSGNSLSFKAPGSQLLEFAAVNTNGNFNKPVINTELTNVGWIENQNYHGVQSADMIIVTPNEFRKQAVELANFHESKDNLNVFVADLKKIYNEYSSGNPDIAAIRDFARDVYLKPDQELKYLLLFGDGSYNNLSKHPMNFNFIPTYQSKESIYAIQTYVSDDFYGLMDENEGETNGMLDLAVGRMPIKDTIEANIVLNKIYEYYESLETEKWHLNITYIGDDPDNTGSQHHMYDANLRANQIASSHPEYILNKIYADAYRQVTTSRGDRYPDVNKAINDALLKGQLMINYSGHGGEIGLAHERILTLEDIESWSNKGKYPVFVTATCELSRFDLSDDQLKKDETTAGEKIFLKEDGGGICLFTTTRVVYQNRNRALNKSFHNNAFVRNENGEYRTMGEIIRNTKIDYFMDNSNISGKINGLNFSLLGNPAMKIAFAGHKVVTDSINGISLSEYTDTIHALQKVSISGHIENHSGQTLHDYNGLLYSTILDKPKEVQTLNNDGNGAYKFELQKDIIFSGRSSINNGYFNLEFIVPKDIAFFTGPGKISYYATDSVSNGSGYLDSLVVGGFFEAAEEDNQGPFINLYLNDSTFKPGGITNANPVLFAQLKDENGINTSSYNVGHDIIAYLDGDENNPIILNDYYQSAIDSYQEGFITYPMTNLEPGMHTLTLKVWDTHNNSGEASIQFNVTGSNNLKLNKIINYPNPFAQHTHFNFEHNMPNQNLDVRISIYDLAGNKMGILNKEIFTSGFSATPVPWNGTLNGSPIAAGLYIYTVEVENEDGSVSRGHGKMIKSR